MTNLSSFVTNSCWECGDSYVLTKAQMKCFRINYLERESAKMNPYASTLLAKDLSGFPPAFIITYELDVLRDEGKAYGKRLRLAGFSVKAKRYNGMIHALFPFAGSFDQVLDAIDEASAALREAYKD